MILSDCIYIALSFDCRVVESILVDDILDVVADARAKKFDSGLLHGPKADEGSGGISSILYAAEFVFIHGIARQS